MAEAEAELAKTVVRAGVTGRVEQFLLQVGDIVNPLMRPAGVLVPEGRGLRKIGLAAGFGQIEAQVMRPGMPAEATCASLPWTVVPMVVTNVQGYIATGQLRGTDQLLDLQQFRQPGTILVTLEPLYEGGLDGVVPGSSCIANAYTSNHEALAEPGIGMGRWVALHIIDAVGVVHAVLLRIQTILLPFRTLVLSGGH
jgi:multidrug resistance efflux pump